VHQFPLAFGCFIEVCLSPPPPPSANASESAPAHDFGKGRALHECRRNSTPQRLFVCVPVGAAPARSLFKSFGFVLLQDIGIECISSTPLSVSKFFQLFLSYLLFRTQTKERVFDFQGARSRVADAPVNTTICAEDGKH
jgi:hypothetical protein